MADEHLGYFAPDYRSARDGFLAAAARAGAVVETFENPAPAPDGSPVFTDVARLGRADASRVLLLNSATHGVEGFCGSGVLTGLLASGETSAIPENVRLVLVHAINPHGFAWLRRVTEDNVDLNRNFIDHGVARARNVEYDGLHDVLVPKKWNVKTIAQCDAKFEDFIRKHSEMALQGAVTRGQYHHADGLFYGGSEATWSRRTFIDIVERYVAGASDVCFLDFHTGLGRYGAAELIGGGDRARDWFGDGMPPPRTASSSAPGLGGVIGSAVRKFASDANITSLTVEFGTYPVREVLRALQADNWLHVHGDVDSKLGREIKADVRLRLYPDEDDWKEMVWVRARQIVRRALRGLAKSSQ
jgi:hypothetical protein